MTLTTSKERHARYEVCYQSCTVVLTTDLYCGVDFANIAVGYNISDPTTFVDRLIPSANFSTDPHYGNSYPLTTGYAAGVVLLSFIASHDLPQASIQNFYQNVTVCKLPINPQRALAVLSIFLHCLSIFIVHQFSLLFPRIAAVWSELSYIKSLGSTKCVLNIIMTSQAMHIVCCPVLLAIPASGMAVIMSRTDSQPSQKLEAGCNASSCTAFYIMHIFESDICCLQVLNAFAGQPVNISINGLGDGFDTYDRNLKIYADTVYEYKDGNYSDYNTTTTVYLGFPEGILHFYRGPAALASNVAAAYSSIAVPHAFLQANGTNALGGQNITSSYDSSYSYSNGLVSRLWLDHCACPCVRDILFESFCQSVGIPELIMDPAKGSCSSLQAGACKKYVFHADAAPLYGCAGDRACYLDGL